MTTPHTIYTISQLNGAARLLLEENLGIVWVMGELSNLSTPSSGHLYFTLKDPSAQVKCALFRYTKQRTAFTPENGQQIIARAQVSLYEGRGDFQLIIQEMQLAGHGALQIAFDKLKAKLQAEGLFDDAHKKPIPKFVQRVGIITSPTGAAIHDILTVLNRRSPHTSVIIYPALVQGSEAKSQLTEAIQIANNRQECDVLILARGGGSLEDLWPFNEEIVARAIFKSKIPVVTGVGHEVDITIADFVADYRAPTPSAAAEYISIDQSELWQALKHIELHLEHRITHQLQQLQQQLMHLQKRLRHPRDLLREQIQHIDQLEQRLLFIMNTLLERKTETLHYMAQKLDALSPLSTLKRGFSMVTKDHLLIRSVKELHSGDTLQTQLSDGIFECIVHKILC